MTSHGSPPASSSVAAMASPNPMRRAHNNGNSNSNSNNNYAEPHTPIASAKRPRAPGSCSKATLTLSAEPHTPNAHSSSHSSSSSRMHSPQAQPGYGLGLVHPEDGKENCCTPKASSSSAAHTNTNHTPQQQQQQQQHPGMTPMMGAALTPMHPARPVTEADRAPSESSCQVVPSSHDRMLATTATAGLESVAEEHADHVPHSSSSSSSSSIMANMCAPNASGSSWVGSVSKSLFSPVLSLFQNNNNSGSTSPMSGVGSHSASEPHELEYKETHAAGAAAADVATETETMDTTGVGSRRDLDGDVAMANAANVVYEAHKVSHSTCSTTTVISTAHNDVHTDDLPQESSNTSDTYGHMHTIQKQDGASIDDTMDDKEEIQAPHQQQQQQQHSQDQDYVEEEEEEEFNPYLFIKCLPYYSSVVPHPQNKICLPPKSRDSPPIALVLDLDETLVHCTVEPTPNADMIFPVNFNGIEYQVHVRTRPFLFEFLERVSQHFEVICFTASQQVYADELLDRIDPGRKHIRHRMFRESCLSVEGNYLKDLNVLGRDLRKAVLVDNSPHAFGYQVDNGIPIESWFDDPHDTELLKLERFLRTLHDHSDVRQAVRAKFQTHKLIERA